MNDTLVINMTGDEISLAEILKMIDLTYEFPIRIAQFGQIPVKDRIVGIELSLQNKDGLKIKSHKIGAGSFL